MGQACAKNSRANVNKKDEIVGNWERLASGMQDTNNKKMLVLLQNIMIANQISSTKWKGIVWKALEAKAEEQKVGFQDGLYYSKNQQSSSEAVDASPSNASTVDTAAEEKKFTFEFDGLAVDRMLPTDFSGAEAGYLFSIIEEEPIITVVNDIKIQINSEPIIGFSDKTESGVLLWNQTQHMKLSPRKRSVSLDEQVSVEQLPRRSMSLK